MAQALTGVTKKYGNLVMCYVDDVVISGHRPWKTTLIGSMRSLDA